jgi:hypothetical protein
VVVRNEVGVGERPLNAQRWELPTAASRAGTCSKANGRWPSRRDTDGNPTTVGDPTWSSFIVTPPFPDYVSGHSTFSGAAARVLAMFFGTDDIAFTTGSDFLPGETRHFVTFSAAAREAALSRLYGGIHYRSANEDGLMAGVEIGEWTVTHWLRPKRNRSRK